MMKTTTFKTLRKAAHLTQRQVADELKVTTATYSRYETGKISPDANTLVHLANIFRVSLDTLLHQHSSESTYYENLLINKVSELEVNNIIAFSETGLCLTEPLPNANKQVLPVAVLCSDEGLLAAGIRQGDICLVQPQANIPSGTYVALRVKNTCILRQLTVVKDLLLLETCNPGYQTTVLSAAELESLEVVGVLCEIRRRFEHPQRKS